MSVLATCLLEMLGCRCVGVGVGVVDGEEEVVMVVMMMMMMMMRREVVGKKR